MKLHINIIKCDSKNDRIRLISTMTFKVKPTANFKDTVGKCTMLLDENVITTLGFSVFLELEQGGKKYKVDNTIIDIQWISCIHAFTLLDEFSDMDGEQFHMIIAKLNKEMGWTS